MTKKVLIVEDNALNVQVYECILETAGFDTVASRSAVEALAIIRDEKPDVILMDIELPLLSGLEATRRLKTDDALAHIPIIAVTAHAMPGDEARCLTGGCADYMSKPVSVQRLVEAVSRHTH